MVYLVGVEGLTSEPASRHNDLQRVFDRVTEIFGEIDRHIARDEIRCVDMNHMDSSVRFSILCSFGSL